MENEEVFMQSYQQKSDAGLTRDHWDVPIRVRLLPFVAFSRVMDGQLDALVGRWHPKAAPHCHRRGLQNCGATGTA
jgi:hypothetical protein